MVQSWVAASSAVPWGHLTALGDGKAPKAVQPSPNPSDLRLPRAMEPQINVTRNLTYLNHALILKKDYTARGP